MISTICSLCVPDPWPSLCALLITDPCTRYIMYHRRLHYVCYTFWTLTLFLNTPLKPAYNSDFCTPDICILYSLPLHSVPYVFLTTEFCVLHNCGTSPTSALAHYMPLAHAHWATHPQHLQSVHYILLIPALCALPTPACCDDVHYIFLTPALCWLHTLDFCTLWSTHLWLLHSECHEFLIPANIVLHTSDP